MLVDLNNSGEKRWNIDEVQEWVEDYAKEHVNIGQLALGREGNMELILTSKSVEQESDLFRATR